MRSTEHRSCQHGCQPCLQTASRLIIYSLEAGIQLRQAEIKPTSGKQSVICCRSGSAPIVRCIAHLCLQDSHRDCRTGGGQHGALI